MDINRRKLAFGLLSLPAAAALNGCAVPPHSPRPSEFLPLATDRLALELEDRPTAELLAPAIVDAGFMMAPPKDEIAAASLVIGFAFGNRPNPQNDPNKLALPGPMNRVLAHCCAAVYRKKALPMYLQWEIARCLLAPEFADIPRHAIISIEPYWDAQGRLVYLSTDGVVETILKNHFANDPTLAGNAAIIGHHDHVKRCIITCRGRRIHGFAPRGIALPRWYDRRSAQPWTRRRDLYVLQDVAAQLSMAAQTRIAQAYPNG